VLHSDQSVRNEQWLRLLEVEKTPVTRAMREGAQMTSSRGS
jgi:hypothetical protein